MTLPRYSTALTLQQYTLKPTSNARFVQHLDIVKAQMRPRELSVDLKERLLIVWHNIDLNIGVPQPKQGEHSVSIVLAVLLLKNLRESSVLLVLRHHDELLILHDSKSPFRFDDPPGTVQMTRV